MRHRMGRNRQQDSSTDRKMMHLDSSLFSGRNKRCQVVFCTLEFCAPVWWTVAPSPLSPRPLFASSTYTPPQQVPFSPRFFPYIPQGARVVRLVLGALSPGGAPSKAR